jgi:hypothetical protein
MIAATITDNVAVDTGGNAPRVYFRKNSGAYVSNACVSGGGSLWNCTIDYSLVGGAAFGDTITYFVIAQDTSGNVASNPAGAVATNVNTVTTPPSAPNLYSIGPGAVPSGTYTNISLSNNATFGGNVTVMNDLSLDGIVNTGANTLTIECGATVTNAPPNEYVVGNIKKMFCSTGSFIFDVGTAPDNMLVAGINPEYTPMTANVTAGTFPSSLTVVVFDQFLPGSSTTQSASRYWEVTEIGDLTADLSFTYLATDVVGSEATYQVLRRSGTTAVYSGGTVNAMTHTGMAPGVTNFSGWAAGVLGPVAAGVEIGGRIRTADGRGIRNARMVLTNLATGEQRTVITGPFGTYRFTDVQVGLTYTVTVNAKRFRFNPSSRVLTVFEELNDFDFTAEP